jgi:hypothetical protein
MVAHIIMNKYPVNLAKRNECNISQVIPSGVFVRLQTLFRNPTGPACVLEIWKQSIEKWLQPILLILTLQSMHI